MTWLFIGILIAAGIWAALRWYGNADPALVRKGLAGFALVFLLAVVVILVLTGRATAALPFLGGAFLAYTRLRQGYGLAMFLRRLWGATTNSQRQTSEIETPFLSMSLDKSSGEMDGRILQGVFAGQRLSALSNDELLEKYAELRRADKSSAQLLEAYLDRIIGPQWRQQAGANAGAGSPGPTGSITKRQAAEILGVALDANKDEIVAAHKRLMKVAHPDQGGSDYLAQQINAAKDVLLKA